MTPTPSESVTGEQALAIRDLPTMSVEGRLPNGALLVRITGKLFRMTRYGYLHPMR